MSRSSRHVDRYTDIRRITDADVAREKSVQDEINASAKRYRRKEFLTMMAYCGCWVAIGLFLAYQLYQRGA